jgi:hypothetical protein
VLPATLIVPVREFELGLSVTVNVTVPLPLPLPPDVIVMKLSLLVAVQPQVAEPLEITLMAPPAAEEEKDIAVGEAE